MTSDIMDRTAAEEFSAGFYFRTLSGLLGEPRSFFQSSLKDAGCWKPFQFLLVSSILFTAASMISNDFVKPVVSGGIFFLNALGTPAISAAIGYMAMVMILGKRVSFSRFFALYAFASGVTLLASWAPYFIFITEPWRWWLIGAGMTRGFGFKRRHALLIIIISIFVLALSVYSILLALPSGGA